MLIKICENCKKEFSTNDKRRKCCNWDCRNAVISKKYKGRKFTKEHKENIRKNHHNVSGKFNPRWKGGEVFNGSGYVWIWSPNHPHKNNYNYVLKHRLVMEEKIGRYLLPKEIVHHINGIKNDNRIENLKLFNNLKEHSTLHSKSSKRDLLNRFAK